MWRIFCKTPICLVSVHVKPGKRLPYLLTGNYRSPKEYFQNAPISKSKEQKAILGYLEEVEIKCVSAKENVEGNLPESRLSIIQASVKLMETSLQFKLFSYNFQTIKTIQVS